MAPPARRPVAARRQPDDVRRPGAGPGRPSTRVADDRADHLVAEGLGLDVEAQQPGAAGRARRRASGPRRQRASSTRRAIGVVGRGARARGGRRPGSRARRAAASAAADHRPRGRAGAGTCQATGREQRVGDGATRGPGSGSGAPVAERRASNPSGATLGPTATTDRAAREHGVRPTLRQRRSASTPASHVDVDDLAPGVHAGVGAPRAGRASTRLADDRGEGLGQRAGDGRAGRAGRRSRGSPRRRRRRQAQADGARPGPRRRSDAAASAVGRLGAVDGSDRRPDPGAGPGGGVRSGSNRVKRARCAPSARCRPGAGRASGSGCSHRGGPRSAARSRRTACGPCPCRG